MSIDNVWTAVGLDRAPAAVLWDMDGTIIDSESEWARFTRQMVLEAGGVWTGDDEAYILGANSADHGARMAQAIERGGGDHRDAQAMFDELGALMTAEVYAKAVLLPGARELLVAFRDAGIPQAMVTATPKDVVDVALEALGEAYFNAVVTGSEDIPGKPDPAPYLLGAQRLAADPGECLAFEDSVAGLAAARASGAHVVDVNEGKVAELATLLK